MYEKDRNKERLNWLSFFILQEESYGGLDVLFAFVEQEDIYALYLYLIEEKQYLLAHHLFFSSSTSTWMDIGQIFAYAIENGCLAALKCLRLDFRLRVTSNSLDKCLRNDYFETLKWLSSVRTNLAFSPETAMKNAIQSRNLQLVQWLHAPARNVKYNLAEVMEIAAKEKCLDIAYWLFAHSNHSFQISSWNIEVILHICLQNEKDNHIELLSWDVYRKGVHYGSFCATQLAGLAPVLDFLECEEIYPVMDWAAASNDLKLLQKLHQDSFLQSCCTSNAMDIASKRGFYDIVLWLHENRTEGCTTLAMDGAAENGHLAILQWLHTNRSEGCTKRAMDRAASNGFLEIVKWLHSNRQEGCTSDAMNGAATNGHLEVIQWLHFNRTEGCTFHAMDHAAGENHFEVVHWLYSNREEGCTATAAWWAGSKGYLEMTKWLFEHYQSQWTSSCINFAAIHGHIDLVRWYHQEICGAWSISLSGVCLTAEHGHLEMAAWLLEYLPKHQFIFIESFEKFKSMKQHIALEYIDITLKYRTELIMTPGIGQEFICWLASKGQWMLLQKLMTIRVGRSVGSTLILTKKVVYTILQSKEGDVMRWLLSVKPDLYTPSIIYWAATNNLLPVLKYVVSMRVLVGKHYDRSMRVVATRAAFHGHIDLLQWLHEDVKWFENKWEEGSDRLVYLRHLTRHAACHGHIEILEWLHKWHVGTFSTLTADFAARYGHFSVVEWLQKRMNISCSPGRLE